MAEKQCPDGGTCHHGCEQDCFRVKFAGPLSGVYPDDKWPQSVRAENNAWILVENIEEAVEQRIFDYVSEEADCDHTDGKMWVCSHCISRVAVAETRKLIADEIEQMAVDYSQEPASGVTSQSIRSIRVAFVREVARRVAEGPK